MPSVTIDDKEYNLDDLSEGARSQLASLRVTDQKIAQLQTELAIVQTARIAYANALKMSLINKKFFDKLSYWLAFCEPFFIQWLFMYS